MMKRLAILVLAVCVLMCGATALASEEDEYLCTLYDDGVKVLAYYGSDTTVVIPETLSGYPVRALDEFFSQYSTSSDVEVLVIPDCLTTVMPNALFDFPNLQSIEVSPNNEGLEFVDSILYDKINHALIMACPTKTSGALVIPQGVQSVCEGAFLRCGITSVSFPDSLTRIDKAAFKYCDKLSEVNLPEGLIELGNNAFFDCDAIETVRIPSTVTTIGKNPFEGCSGLKSIEVAEGNGAYAAVDGALICTSDGTLVCYPCGKSDASSYAVPEGVKVIGPGAFRSCKSLEEITLPEGLTEIGDDAFEGLDKLRSLELPGTVTTIGWSSFLSCWDLETLTIPASVTKIKNLGVNSSTTVRVAAGSYAEQFCKENGINYENY